MKINKITSPSYSIIKQPTGRYRLVKVIGEYNSVDEANSDMYKLLTNQKTEQEVYLEKWVKDQIHITDED
jgi:hypothetical protein